jgi:hypothetical protein
MLAVMASLLGVIGLRGGVLHRSLAEVRRAAERDARAQALAAAAQEARVADPSVDVVGKNR